MTTPEHAERVTHPTIAATGPTPPCATSTATSISASPAVKGRPRSSSQTTSRTSCPSHSSCNPLSRSCWIEQVLYRNGFLALILKPAVRGPQDRRGSPEPVALLYGPHVPSWVPGLIQAGEGGRSVGSAFNSLMKSEKGKEMMRRLQISYQRVEGETEVGQLKEMML